MPNKKNLPNIPIYIGDWEKDCNVLSVKSEGAWFRIVRKMFTNGKQSVYKIPTKGLQNIWNVSEEEAKEIVQEFIDFDICEVRYDGRFVEFTCRRFAKENEISEKRSDAVSNRSDRKKRTTKPLQNNYKSFTNDVQNTDIDIDNENDNVNEIEKEKGGVGEKTTKTGNRNDVFLSECLTDQSWIETVCMQSRKTPEAIRDKLSEFHMLLRSLTDEKPSKKEFISHFVHWLNSKSEKENKNGTATATSRPRRNI